MSLWSLWRRPRLTCVDEVNSRNQCTSCQMFSSLSSPPSSHAPRIKYDVFISFRGSDTRRGFLSHLLKALSRAKIEAYVDYKLREGDELSSTLFTAIEESQIALIIFSKDYASSKWCLEELVKITECMMKNEQIVVPIFYNVDPSDVRHQKGCYKNAFAKHEKLFKANTIEKWKTTLNKVANLSGFHSINFGTEATFIEKVVQRVLTRLNQKYQVNLNGLIGIDKPIADLKPLISCTGSNVRIIGIWGMGGIGKTTIAGALFDLLCSEYEACCFLANVRVESEKFGIIQLKRKLISILLEKKDLNIDIPNGVPGNISSRLRRTKALIVLDDVDDSDQVTNLIGGHDWLGSGSRIIVTTRDKHVICKEADDIYEVRALGCDDSLKLLNLHAFKNGNHVQMNWHELMMKVVEYAKGLPLALKVLGSFLNGKNAKEWESQLQKLQKMPYPRIQAVLRLSYEGLDREERHIFLTIACFFHERVSKDDVEIFLDASGCSTPIALRNLQDKALIEVCSIGDVSMHDLIREMGREIVREQNIERPGERSHLWDPNEICHVLEHNEGTEHVECITLNMSRISDLILSPQSFAGMVNLKFLRLYAYLSDSRSRVHLPEGLNMLSDKIILFHWDGCPSKSLPATFNAENLVELRMRGSRLKKLWDGVQVDLLLVCADQKAAAPCIDRERRALLHFKAALDDDYGMLSSWGTDEGDHNPNCCQWKGVTCNHLTGHVQRLDLHGDYYDFDEYTGLPRPYLSGEIHTSLIELQQLQYLNLSVNDFGDSHIPEFFASMTNLRYLDLSHCYFVGKIPSRFGTLSHLKYLNLGSNSLEGSIPYQLGNLSKLQYLDLSGNYLNGTIPSQLGNLSSLHKLYLGQPYFDEGALKIDVGSRWLSTLTSLTHLDLSGVLNFNTSHSWLQMIGKLPKLRELILADCSLSDIFILSLYPFKFNFSTSLSVLDLYGNAFTSPSVFQWLSNVSFNLVELSLSGNILEGSTSKDFGSTMIGKLPKLRELRLSDCNLSDYFLLLLTHSKFNFSTSLSVLDLSLNSFTSFKIFECVSNISPNLIELDLSENLLEGNKSSHFSTMMNSLEQLDLSRNRLKGGDLKSFMNICTLRSLYVDGNNFTEDLPSILQILSGGCVRYSLQKLDLSQNQIMGTLSKLSPFPSLKTLDLSQNQLSGKIPEGTRLPPKLESLIIQSNSLEGGIPKLFGNICTLGLLDLFNNSLNKELSVIIHEFSGCARHSLKELYLGMNQINGTLPDLSLFYALRKLDLDINRLNGKIPKESRLPSRLEYLSITSNSLEGGIPLSFGNTCTLRSLDFSNNSLSEELWVIIHNLSGCARYSLKELYLDMNQICGTLPDFSIFSSLRTLDLSKNQLNGKVQEDIQFPSQLQTLYMSSNHLEGVITDSHFVKKSKLTMLDLSYNSVALVFNQNWIAPFQLEEIRLRSCKLGPLFPKWLQTQNKVYALDISNAGISDIVPEWFWAKLLLELGSINISYNNLHGKIPNLPLRNSYYFLTLTSNQFEGSIPPFLQGAMSLDLSNNKLSDFHSFVCTSGPVETLGYLDLSNNQLSRQIPDCWSYFKSLAYLDLSYNQFSGRIPASMGSLLELQVLLLRNNSLSEEIPTSMKSCTKLSMLDVRENELSGHIPCWIGSELQELQILSLQKNHFFGSLPLQLCHLKGVQLIDLSLNNLSGQIPKCINNFTSMTQMNFSRKFSRHFYDVNISSLSVQRYSNYYDLSAFLMWKGVEQVFKNTALSLLKSIDLSNNQLSGEIPTEIENLFGLISLNLSKNNLTGKIPTNIGRLTSLEFLDLSRNQLIGSIPSSLAHIDRLTMLDVSHNHLSGEIPTGTQLQSFNATSYEDNTSLCGKPLDKLCIIGEPPQEPMVKFDEDEHLTFTHAFYMSMAFGFFVGFWGIFSSILVKRSWRHAYFGFLNNLTDNIYVMIAVKVAKYKR